MSEQEKKTKGLIFAILTNFIDSPDRAIAATDSIYHNAVVPHGNSRELEGRIDEINRFDNEYVKVMSYVQGLHERGGYYDERIKELVESQKEKTNE